MKLLDYFTNNFLILRSLSFPFGIICTEKVHIVFRPNIAPLVLVPRNMLSHTLHFSRLKQHSMINKKHNLSLNNFECCFVMVLTLISCQI